MTIGITTSPGSVPLVSEIANILPEVVYCCFTRATLFTTIFYLCVD